MKNEMRSDLKKKKSFWMDACYGNKMPTTLDKYYTHAHTACTQNAKSKCKNELYSISLSADSVTTG